jgi:2-hydroxychromene-2-carboxylate isomerase
MTTAQTTVDFWFDPCCPFTWRTSRWLTDVAERAELPVHWRLMSLAVLNEGQEVPEQHQEVRRQAWRALRVLAAAQQAGGPEAVGRLYTALGRRQHEQGQAYDDDVLGEAVAEAGLAAHLAKAADDESWDATIRASHEEGQRRVGTALGSPILALDGARGYFGPIVVPPPHGAEADRLFEAIRLLSSIAGFSELKTARASFGPGRPCA